MFKEVSGYCNKQNTEYKIQIDCIPAETTEGIEYTKAGMICQFNSANHTCQDRNDCSIWKCFAP